MFYTVTKNLVKFISAYFFFLAGFSFSFYLLFNKYHEAFQSPWRSFLRTFAMMLGDPNYEEYFLIDYLQVMPCKVKFWCYILLGL